jgi:hypothetical protein
MRRPSPTGGCCTIEEKRGPPQVLPKRRESLKIKRWTKQACPSESEPYRFVSKSVLCTYQSMNVVWGKTAVCCQHHRQHDGRIQSTSLLKQAERFLTLTWLKDLPSTSPTHHLHGIAQTKATHLRYYSALRLCRKQTFSFRLLITNLTVTQGTNAIWRSEIRLRHVTSHISASGIPLGARLPNRWHAAIAVLTKWRCCETFLHKSLAVRIADWMFIIGAPVRRWLGEYVTLDRTF